MTTKHHGYLEIRFHKNTTNMDITKRPVGRPRLRDKFKKDKQIKFLASTAHVKKLDAMSKKTGKSKGQILRELLQEA